MNLNNDETVIDFKYKYKNEYMFIFQRRFYLRSRLDQLLNEAIFFFRKK